MASEASQHTSTYWRSMTLFNAYRLCIAGLFLTAYFLQVQRPWWENYDSRLYSSLAGTYVLAGLTACAFTWFKWPRFNRQLTSQVIVDICFIVAIMYATGGVRSGVGLLLVIAIAAASLISHGRLALFYAALATLALLFEQSYEFLTKGEDYSDFTHAAILGVSCFATAWLAYSFAKRASQSETLALQRGIDLENMAQVNALITQEMQDGVMVVDHELRLRHHNLQAESLLKLPGDKWRGGSIEQLSPQISGHVHDWLAGRSSEDAIKLAIDGRELRLRLMPIGGDRRQGAVIFIEDWSQQQLQAQQMKLAALGRLTANMAHEIRNPLSAIGHAGQLLQEELPPDGGTQRMLQIIADNVKRMDQMVEEILELNRRDRTSQEPIVLAEFLEAFHEQFCQVEKIPPRGFQLAIEDTGLQADFDRRHLQQILWNICRNGWRHSRQNSGSLQVSLTTVADSGLLRLEVADDGAGIAESDRVHLFEPFFTTVATGTGLGLYIARELCEANAASLQYVPRAQGCLFVIQMKKRSST